MAAPLPFPGLSAVLGTYGKVFKSRASHSLPPDERPTVTVLIPALDEERTIPYALFSLDAQTVTPDRVVVVDDGSTDDTAAIVDELAGELDFDLEFVQHDEPQGKTVGVKEIARSSDTDTLFVLDADTFIESDDYLEGLLAPHVDGRVASSFGLVHPIDRSSKRAFANRVAAALPEDGVTYSHVERDVEERSTRTPLGAVEPIVRFRKLNYHVEQRFFADALMRLFGSTMFPVGCGVLYDREKLVSVFDDYEDSLGDDLTNSEDIFVGFAFCDRGWDNVQVADVHMRSSVPGLRRTLEQNYLWGSGYLQSAYYFRQLSLQFRRRRLAPDGGTDSVQGRVETGEQDAGVDEVSESAPVENGAAERDVAERDDGGDDADAATEADEGFDVRKPMGWIVAARVIDGLYPTTVLLLLALSLFGVVALKLVAFLVAWEFSLYVLLAVVTLSSRVSILRNVLPFFVLRVVTMPVGTYTYLKVVTDIVTGNRDWRK